MLAVRRSPAADALDDLEPESRFLACTLIGLSENCAFSASALSAHPHRQLLHDMADDIYLLQYTESHAASPIPGAQWQERYPPL
jgi:hypothetical protein